jgi:lysophospholipase L1-like esterase
VWSRRLSGVWSAAVAATVAVLLCACGGPAGPSHQGTPAAGRPVVALGDSYTAGDLMPLSVSSRPLGCLRSSDGYPAQVAKALGVTAGLVDVSCTGAGVKEMTEPQKTYLGTNPPQFSALASDDSLVMLTLGGDDMGFMNGLKTCMKLSLTDPFGSPCQSHFNSGGTDQLGAQAAAEGAKLVAVLGEIRARAPHARVLLVGYPDLFPQQGGCWPVVPITDGDIGYLRGIETQLNAVLAHAAQVAGATFVNTYAPTIGHDFCQRSTAKDVEGLVPTSLAAPFHPNARGQAAIAALVLGALRAG